MSSKLRFTHYFEQRSDSLCNATTSWFSASISRGRGGVGFGLLAVAFFDVDLAEADVSVNETVVPKD